MKREYTDEQIEDMWRELEDVTLAECEEGRLVIASPWRHFEKQTHIFDIWMWFNSIYSKGILYLVMFIE